MTLKMKRLMMVGSFLLVGVILLGSPRSVRAADGDLDPSFNSSHSVDGAVRATVVQPDGKIIIGGLFTSFDGTVCNHIARLNSDGSLDAKFNPGTGANSNVNAIAVQPDGRIIIAGNFTSFAGTTRVRVARLNEGGSLDTSFDPIPGPDRSVLTTSLQADGKIIIGGDFLGFVGMFNRFDGIARLNTNGSLDTSFDPVISGKRPDTIRGVSLTAVQTDGKIIIGELFILGRDIPIRYIERLNQDGSLDTSFAPGTGPD